MERVGEGVKMEWKCVDEELPPKDGLYEVTSSPHSNFIGIAMYDGYGFKVEEIYRCVGYWRDYGTKPKRYGKVNKCDGS